MLFYPLLFRDCALVVPRAMKVHATTRKSVCRMSFVFIGFVLVC
jgi:hypothetical protein